MPELQAFQDAHPDAQVIAVNVGEAPQTALRWMETRGLDLTTAFDPNSEVMRLYAARGLPTSFIIAPNGIIRHIFYGATTRAALEAHLTD
jgi:peroxiredoxin